MVAGIYKIESKSSGRIYIGSSKDVELRISQHMSSLKSNRHSCNDLSEEFNRYGESNFTYEILETVDDTYLLSSLEKGWYFFYKKKLQRHMFNIVVPYRSDLQLNAGDEAFLKFFCEDLEWFFRLKGNQIKVILALASNMDLANIVSVSGLDIKRISKEIGITYNAFHVAFSQLIKDGIIVCHSHGNHMVNPSMIRKFVVSDSIEIGEVHNDV